MQPRQRARKHEGGDDAIDSERTRNGDRDAKLDDQQLLRTASKAPGPSSSRQGARTALLSFKDLPEWQQDNAYIRTSYRPASYSFTLSFASLFYLHNEFVNIHTHYMGGLIFAGYPLYLYFRSSPPPKPLVENLPHPTPWTSADTLAFACFITGAVVCLFTSATYHTISNHSHAVASFGNKLDYAGIVVLITGSFIPSVYYGFYCEPVYQYLYWIMISTLGVVCTVVSVTPKFRTPLWRPFRAAMFVGMGCSAVFPVLHGLVRWGWQDMEERIGLNWLLLQGALYISGAGLYAARIPEKWSPGTFDVWGSSHQIFHVLVVLAACSHLVGLLKAGEYAHTMNGAIVTGSRTSQRLVFLGGKGLIDASVSWKFRWYKKCSTTGYVSQTDFADGKCKDSIEVDLCS